MPAHFLYDDRVALRPLEDSDAPLLAAWVNDQAVLLYLGIPGRLTAGQELEWITTMRGSQRDIVLGIVDRSDDALVGTVGLHAINTLDSNAMYGIMLGDKTRWSRGLGTAAGMLMCDHGFNTRNLHRLHLTVAAFNPRGLKSYERIGFEQEGRFSEHVFKDGAYHDVISMGLSRRRFNALHADWIVEQRRRYGIDTSAN